MLVFNASSMRSHLDTQPGMEDALGGAAWALGKTGGSGAAGALLAVRG